MDSKKPQLSARQKYESSAPVQVSEKVKMLADKAFLKISQDKAHPVDAKTWAENMTRHIFDDN